MDLNDDRIRILTKNNQTEFNLSYNISLFLNKKRTFLIEYFLENNFNKTFFPLQSAICIKSNSEFFKIEPFQKNSDAIENIFFFYLKWKYNHDLLLNEAEIFSLT